MLLGINLVLGFAMSGVDWRAHLGGLVTGAVVAAIFVFAPRRHQVLWQTAGCLVVLVVLIGLTMLRTAQLQDFLSPIIPGLQT